MLQDLHAFSVEDGFIRKVLRKRKPEQDDKSSELIKICSLSSFLTIVMSPLRHSADTFSQFR